MSIRIPNPPDLDDGISYYVYAPCESTLYGYEGQPFRFLRVMPNGIDNFMSSVTRDIPVGGGNYNEARFSVESITLSTFLSYIAFGYTPYVETLFTVKSCGLEGYEDIKPLLLTHALCRSYEARAKNLISIGRRKSSSIITRTSGESYELVAELKGCLSLWQELLDTGMISPKNVLSSVMRVTEDTLSNRVIKECNEWFLELQARMLVGNHFNLPYKIDDSTQSSIMGMWG